MNQDHVQEVIAILDYIMRNAIRIVIDVDYLDTHSISQKLYRNDYYKDNVGSFEYYNFDIENYDCGNVKVIWKLRLYKNTPINDTIQCEDRAKHYGVPIGTIIGTRNSKQTIGTITLETPYTCEGSSKRRWYTSIIFTQEMLEKINDIIALREVLHLL